MSSSNMGGGEPVLVRQSLLKRPEVFGVSWHVLVVELGIVLLGFVLFGLRLQMWVFSGLMILPTHLILARVTLDDPAILRLFLASWSYPRVMPCRGTVLPIRRRPPLPSLPRL